MKTKFIKLFSLALTVVLIMSVCPLTAFADSRVENNTMAVYPALYNSPSGSVKIENLVNLSEFRPYLLNAIKTYSDECVNPPELSGLYHEIDISGFEIPYSDENYQVIADFVFYGLPEAFNVSGVAGCKIVGTLFSSICFTYNRTDDEYNSALVEFYANADRLLDGIEENQNLTNVEKALLLHDRLALWNEYDYDNYLQDTVPIDSYTAYGALAKRVSVCQGYSFAYMYLLSRVGIKSEYCTSQEMCHGWNIVYIDNIPYHVDVTHDDSRERLGELTHDFFLVSTGAYYNGSPQHKANDYDTTPQDTRYDNAKWRLSLSAAQLFDDEVYLIDHRNEQIKRFDNGEYTKVLDIPDIWWPQYVNMNYFAKLSVTETGLLYSLSKGIYSYNPNTGNNKRVLKLKGDDVFYNIYGFNYENGNLIYELSSNLITFRTESKEYNANDFCQHINPTWEDNGRGWRYVYEDGCVLKNEWAEDSIGWCYLDNNGYMVTNKWIKDSVGWCYVGSNGYCLTNTWMADSIGWCYLDGEGRMATNKWILDSVGWCYVGSEGYCLTNTWMADSIGWCYLDSEGRMAVNKWIMDSVGWCYVGSQGYCLTNTWMADSVGWCYLDKEGRMIVNNYVRDSHGLCYLDRNGYWDGIYR